MIRWPVVGSFSSTYLRGQLFSTIYMTRSQFSNRYFMSKQMEHPFHRKTFINFSRFVPLVIEVNQSEILENYNTFITQHDATIPNYLLPSQDGQANYFHKHIIFGSFFI